MCCFGHSWAPPPASLRRRTRGSKGTSKTVSAWCAARRSATAGDSSSPLPAELLIVATDGLWEVVSNEEAVELAAAVSAAHRCQLGVSGSASWQNPSPGAGSSVHSPPLAPHQSPANPPLDSTPPQPCRRAPLRHPRRRSRPWHASVGKPSLGRACTLMT